MRTVLTLIVFGCLGTSLWMTAQAQTGGSTYVIGDQTYYVANNQPLTQLLEVAWSKHLTGYDDGALAYYSIAAERFPTSYDAVIALAGHQYKMGLLDEAGASYQHAADLAETDANQLSANYFIQRIASEQAWGKEATEAFEAGYNAYSNALSKEAVNWLEQAVIAAPEWFEARLWLGHAYRQVQRQDEAVVQYTFVLENAPEGSSNHESARWILGAY